MKYFKRTLTVLLLLSIIIKTLTMLIFSQKVLSTRHEYATFSELVVELRTMEPLMTYECYKTISPDFTKAIFELGKISGQPSIISDIKIRGFLPNKVVYTYRVKNPNVSADRLFLVEFKFGVLKIKEILWKEIVDVK